MSDEFIYGIHPALETLAARRREINEALVLKGLKHPRARQLRHELSELNIPLQEVDRHALSQAADTREHQGVVLRCSAYPYAPIDDAWSERLVVLLDNLEDPHNVGAIMRTAEGLGVQHVLLPVKGSPGVYPSVVKASAGAVEHLRVTKDRNSTAYFRQAREAGFHVAALDASGATPLQEWTPPDQPLLLIIGGEDRAVGRYLLNEADTVLSIPQVGRVTSFNASVSAALALYQCFLNRP